MHYIDICTLKYDSEVDIKKKFDGNFKLFQMIVKIMWQKDRQMSM